MSGLSPEAQALQAQLTRHFVAKLPDKLAQFEAAWNQVRESHWSPEPLDHLRSLAHKLAGSAGSYGFDDLGALALSLDIALDSAVNSDEQRLLIEKRAANLINAINQALARASMGAEQ